MGSSALPPGSSSFLRYPENCRAERTLKRSGETVIARWWGTFPAAQSARS